MLETRGVQKAYVHSSQRLQVLKGIDLEVPAGEVVAIVGPSGAGKSTLLHIVGGLDAPDQGQVTLDGQDVYRLNDRQRARLRNEKVGFIFQFYHLLPEFTALENVLLPAIIREQAEDPGNLRSQAAALLDRVGLNDRRQHRPNELSGGEQQRVAIARALMNAPKIILCDEPTGNLDSESGRMVIDLLMELNKRQGQTLVIVTHDDTIARRAHRIIHMRDGQLVTKG